MTAEEINTILTQTFFTSQLNLSQCINYNKIFGKKIYFSNKPLKVMTNKLELMNNHAFIVGLREGKKRMYN